MLEQLRQRNVHRVALAYLAAAWLIVQVVDTLTPDILPAGAFRGAVITLAIGFIPSLVLAWIFEWTPEGLKREHAVPAGTPAPESRWLDRAIMVTLVIAVAYFAIDKFVIDPVRDRAEIEAAAIEAVEDALASNLLEKYANRSVLVLPFLNLSADPEQEYFADGIAEELLNLLAKIEELRVISRSTSWTFKGKDIDIAEIQEKLDVSHILEGSVRRAGNQVRITAQLIDARTDAHLWSETYDRALDYFEQAPPGNREMGRMLAQHDLGRIEEFEAEFSAMRADPEQHPEGIARVAAWTGQNDLAFEQLELAIDREGPTFVQSIKRGGDLYAPITSDPRWQAFLDRYDAVTEQDLSNIRFNPKLPAEVVEALAINR